MTNLLIIVVSLILNAAVDFYLLKKHKIGSEEYKALIKFARNNKNIKNCQNIPEDISDRLSEMENKISDMSVNTKSDNHDLIEIRKEIEALKNAVHNFQSAETGSNDADKVKDTLIRLTSRVLSLENKLSELNISVDTSVMETEITALKKLAEKNNADIVSLKKTVIAQQQMIDLLKKELSSVKNYKSPASDFSETAPKAKVFTSTKIINPDADYVKMLISNLSMIKNELGVLEFSRYADGLKNLLDNGDFDDGEEIMDTVHGLIEKYIYGSDTKVSARSWAELEKYIMSAGYIPVPVKAGDDVTKYKSYFNRPIPAVGGNENTIKQIQQQPYVLTYECDGEKGTVKLCGKCTYYK